MSSLLFVSFLLAAHASAPEGFGPYRFGMSAESSLRAKNCSAFSMVMAPAGDVVPVDEIEAICPWTGVLPAPVEVRLRFRGGRLKETYVVVAMSEASRRSLEGTFTGMRVVNGFSKETWRRRPAERTVFRLEAFAKRTESAAKLLQPGDVDFAKVKKAMVGRLGEPSESVPLESLAALFRSPGARRVERWAPGGKLQAFATYVHEGSPDTVKQVELTLLGAE